MIKLRNLDNSLKSTIEGVYMPGAAEKFYIGKEAAQFDAYWRQRVPGDRYYSNPSSGAGTAIAAALAAMTSGRNDVAILSPDSHTLGAALTWSKNMCHLIGSFGPAMMNQRSRIGATGDFTPMVSVTGYGNTFANLYTMWGADAAANLVGWSVTGVRNNFHNCHFGGPMNAAQAIDGATCFHLDGGTDGAEAYFNSCVFGTDTVERTDGVSSLKLGGVQRSIFKDCLFLSGCDSGADSFMIEAEADAYGWAYFDNCKFINIAASGFANAMALALVSAATSTAFRFLFSAGTTFHGVTDVIAASDEAKVEFGRTATPAAAAINNDVFVGLSVNPDHTSA